MRRVAGAGLIVTVLLHGRVGAAWQRNQTAPTPTPYYPGPQSGGLQTPGRQSDIQTRQSPYDDEAMRALEAKRGKAVNSERQRMMVKEANQMVLAAAELEAGETSGMARDEQAKRAEAIEKLAKSVKERMRGTR